MVSFNEENLMFEYPKTQIKRKSLEKSKIRIRDSTPGLRNKGMKSKLSYHRKNNNSLYQKEVDRLSGYSNKSVTKTRKNTLNSFDKSDYTDAETIVSKQKSQISK